MIDYKSFLFSLLLISLVFFNWSCSKDKDDESVEIIPASGAINATVDNVSWNSVTATALFQDGKISIAGQSADGSQLVLSVTGSTTATYMISKLSFNNVVSFTPTNAGLENPTYASSNVSETPVGEVIITGIDEVNKTITGTFNAKVKRLVPAEKTIIISSGSFTKIPYTKPDGETNTGDNTFSAKVDGANFAPITIGGVIALGKLVLNSSTGTETITISVPQDANTGTYNLETLGSDYYATYNGTSTVYESVSGSITISLHDKTNDRIEGTFNFNAEPFVTGDGTIAVTQGSFGISY